MTSKSKARAWTEKATAVAEHLLKDRYANWSWQAAYALAEFWMDYTNHWNDAELLLGNALPDRVALRCEFSEYESPAEALEDLGLDPEDEPDLMDGAHGLVLRLENEGILLGC